ncbi:MAG: DUF2911 domain-containing protein [Flavobacteriaceae bacterium]|nr:DUF2911 domain-containing protein [Flavobacteriaceae bacterium]
MKNILISFLITIGFNFLANAQIETPMVSPFSKIEQKIGITDVTVEYSRPSMRGRTVFGNIIPFGEIWRTGANVNTKITFSDDVKINGKELKKGTYAFYTIPNKTNWEIIFYQKTDNWGNPKTWDATLESLRFTADVQPLSTSVETFTMLFSNLQNDGATMDLLWESTQVSFKIWVPTNEKVEKKIQQVMSGPSIRDYILAARYYSEQEKELATALIYIDKALVSNPENYSNLRTKALILWKLGKKTEAETLMQQSLKLAKKDQSAEYIKLNEASLKEWK